MREGAHEIAAVGGARLHIFERIEGRGGGVGGGGEGGRDPASGRAAPPRPRAIRRGRASAPPMPRRGAAITPSSRRNTARAIASA